MKFTVPRYGIVSRAVGLGPRDIGRPARGVGAGKAAQAAYNVADKSSKLAKRAATWPQKNSRAQLAAAREALWFEQHAVHFAFEPADLGKIVTINGASYRIVGLRPNARKCPVVLQQLPSRAGRARHPDRRMPRSHPRRGNV
jgi:hypothetical protein